MIEQIVLRNWWVFVFCLFCFIAYEKGLYQYKNDLEYLTKRMEELKIEKMKQKQVYASLSGQIQSQSDPAWIELTLMKELGVVPEGQKKVYFQDDER